MSSFVTAAENGDLNELKRLISIDSTVINKKYKGDTAIMKLSRQCNGYNVIKFLLENLLFTIEHPFFPLVINK